MATSVKMTVRDKQRLDRIQGEIMARQGRRVAQQDILSWLLDLGEAEKSRFSQDDSRPMTPREVNALMHLAVPTGVQTREEEIDLVVTQESR